jgi:endogenous inhibitor of DNA gyrase (YacG/DUF329 family)
VTDATPAEAPRTGWTCPTCGNDVPADGPWRPFCGARCKRVDLGAWLLGHYRVPAVPDPDREPDAATGAPPASDDDDDPAA